MNILYIWDADYPWDVRVEKTCKSLLQNGHEIHIAARNLRKSNVYEQVDGMHIHRLKPWKSDKLNYMMTFPAFFSPIWLKHLNKVIRKHNIGLIIVRDLPMAIAGIWSGRISKIPVIFDMAEDYTAMVRVIWQYSKFEGLNLFVRNPYAAKLVEKYALKRADHILVVVDEMTDIALNGGSDRDKVTIVGNTPPLESFDTPGRDDLDLQPIRDRFSAVYTGGLEMARGIQTVLQAIPVIVREIPDFLFVVVGDGYTRERLENMAVKHGVADHVRWVGWVDHDHIFDYIRSCDVGIIPHFVTPHVDSTIPNKLFDYMGCGVPVVASDARPMKRVIEQERAGITFRSGDAEDLAAAVLEIRAATVDYGRNGFTAVQEKYNWAIDEQRLLTAVRDLGNRS